MNTISTSYPNLNTGSRDSWYTQEYETVLEKFNSNLELGLSTSEAKARLEVYGSNILEEGTKVTWYKIFARQFTNFLILILFAAAFLSLLIGELTDALTILAIVLLNGILGFVQEWKAEQAISALQRMLSLKCKVVRDGSPEEIDVAELVPGDIVLLAIGDRVPADIRLTKTINFKVDEAALTGESTSVTKSTQPVSESTALAERRSMSWMGTSVTNGQARGVVVATGMQTEFGRIAKLTQEVEKQVTPLQKGLLTLAKQLATWAIAVSVTIILIGFLYGKAWSEMVMAGIALAVAVVPEGLPAVVTITLALGIRRMVKRRALLRKLQAAETLGAATVICTDKTGTLTRNEMALQQIWLPGSEFQVNVTGFGYEPSGDFLVNDEKN